MGFLVKEGCTAATCYRFIDPFEPFKEKVMEKGYERLVGLGLALLGHRFHGFPDGVLVPEVIAANRPHSSSSS